MSDQPQYRSDATQQQPGAYVEDPPWVRRGGAEPVQLIKLDRPFYTGMMVGFGLMVASIVALVLMSIVFGILGTVLGGLLTGAMPSVQ